MPGMTSSDSDRAIKVWDPLVRIFHWSLFLFFFIAYLSEDDWETAHVYAGYTVASLVLFRLIWGVIGTRFARFTNFVVKPTATIDYLKEMARGQAPRHLGHNPAAAAMIVALLVFLAMTTLSGMVLLAGEVSGPLADTFFATLPEDPVEEVHEFFANGTLLLVMLHVAGVLVSSWLHRENLVKSMITGRKPSNEPVTERSYSTEGNHRAEGVRS